MGYASTGYKYKNPSADLVHALLKGAPHSMENGWRYRYGWGLVHVDELYWEAYNRGVSDGKNANSGSGWSPY